MRSPKRSDTPSRVAQLHRNDRDHMQVCRANEKHTWHMPLEPLKESVQ